MFDSIEGHADLLRRELTILTQSVQTNYVLDVVSSEWLGFDLWSVKRLVLVGRIVGLTFLLSVSLSIVVIPSLFLLLHEALADTEIVLDTSVIGLYRET